MGESNESHPVATVIGIAIGTALGIALFYVGRWLLKVVWWLVRWHPIVATALVSTLVVAVRWGGFGLVVWSAVLGAVLGGWWVLAEDGFERQVRRRARASWRREWVYRRRWRTAMFLSGLAGRFDGGEFVPRLGRVRSDWTQDQVRLRLVLGQEPADWERASERLAQAFGAMDCRVRSVAPGWLVLGFTVRRHRAIVPALPIPEVPDLDALPIGRRGDGRLWTVRLTDNHILVGGATGAGKGSVMWSMVRALAGGVREGVVQLWVVDPKGGMEFGLGVPMFSRFGRGPVEIAELLEDAARLVVERANRLCGVAREHQASRADPTVVVLVDEIGALTAYLFDRELAKRIAQALALLLSQGRAVGVHVVGAVQDPRKEVVPFRDLLPTRIALRMVEAEQTDLILGKGAYNRGAACERVPQAEPGAGWVLIDGDAEPSWVRASYVTDADIAEMAHDYPAPEPPPGPGVIDVEPVEPQDGGGDGAGAARPVTGLVVVR